MDDIEKTIREDLKSNPRTYKELESDLRGVLRRLVDDNALELGPDETLSGRSLEYRVRGIFEELGFGVQEGRFQKEDLVLTYPKSRPIIVEIKSGKGTSPGLDDLRQLDDWVFTLSEEGRIRRGQYRQRVRRPGTIVNGSRDPRVTSPKPHKGLMVFSGPLGTPFDQRAVSCLHPDHRSFVVDRALCVMPFHLLVEVTGQVDRNPSAAAQLLMAILQTSGELRRL